MKKRLLSLLLFVSMLSGVSAYAYDLPTAFWALNDAYNAALTNGDDAGIINFGTQITDLIQNEPGNEQTHEIMASRLDQVGLAYERTGGYAQAAEAYRKYIPYADAVGWPDGVKIANAKVLQYTPDIQLYTQTNNAQVFYGAKNEPEQGVLYGRNVRDTISGSLNGESMVLVYLNFGDTADIRWVSDTLAEAQKSGSSVEIAWNFPNEANDLAQVKNQNEVINQMISVINEYPDVPVFLRIGAEMNIWGNRATPDAFIDAFRYISSAVKSQTANAAIVWSVAHASAWDIQMEDYYPGDEYVDWVGISAYMMPYFQGRNDWSDFDKFNEVVFASGNSAEPVKLVDEVVRKFGDRKPIMLAECGTSHFVRPLNTDTTDFASVYMRRMYAYLPMIYPQIKAIAYFDVVVDHEINDYALSTSPVLESLYHQKTKDGPFLKNHSGTPSYVYSRLDDVFYTEKSVMPIYTYVHTFGVQEPKIDYYIDGAWVTGSNTLPYTAEIDFSQYSEGEHVLEVVAESNGSVLYKKQYRVIVNSPIQIAVNQNIISSDVPPTMQDGRTLVPIRVISEKLGAEVVWDNDTRRITIQKDGTSAVLTVGSRTASVNGNAVNLDVPAKILGDRTFVPVRAVASMLNTAVDWDNDSRTVMIKG